MGGAAESREREGGKEAAFLGRGALGLRIGGCGLSWEVGRGRGGGRGVITDGWGVDEACLIQLWIPSRDRGMEEREGKGEMEESEGEGEGEAVREGEGGGAALDGSYF